jgi:hypothetical protein
LEDSQQGWKIRTEEVFIAETRKIRVDAGKKIGPGRQRWQDEARMPEGRGQDDREGRMKQQEDRLVKTGWQKGHCEDRMTEWAGWSQDDREDRIKRGWKRGKDEAKMTERAGWSQDHKENRMKPGWQRGQTKARMTERTG